MISVKYAPYVFSFFMSLLMSGVMSLVISGFNVGWGDNIVTIWLKAWMFAFAVAFPTIIVVTPLVRMLVTLVLKQDGEHA